MTQPEMTMQAQAEAPEAPVRHDGFLPVAIRRCRFSAAILFSGSLFWTLGWMIAQPPAPHQAFTLLGWGASPIVPALGILVLLIVGALGSMVLTHPDTPHSAMFCALLGLGALAIRGGTIYPLLRMGDDVVHVQGVYWLLAEECVFWAAILMIAEAVTGRIHTKFFTNTKWIERVAADPAAYRGRKRGFTGLASELFDEMAKQQAEKLKQGKVKPMNVALANFLALAVACAVGTVLLPVFMQSQMKGQVLLAAFVALGLAGFAANMALPQSNVWPILLCVPLTAAIGYWRAKGELNFPGFSATASARALPIDFMAAGVPGALFGYYGAMRWRLSHMFEGEESGEAG